MLAKEGIILKFQSILNQFKKTQQCYHLCFLLCYSLQKITVNNNITTLTFCFATGWVLVAAWAEMVDGEEMLVKDGALAMMVQRYTRDSAVAGGHLMWTMNDELGKEGVHWLAWSCRGLWGKGSSLRELQALAVFDRLCYGSGKTAVGRQIINTEEAISGGRACRLLHG